jgi:hypothetical protein
MNIPIMYNNDNIILCKQLQTKVFMPYFNDKIHNIIIDSIVEYIDIYKSNEFPVLSCGYQLRFDEEQLAINISKETNTDLILIKIKHLINLYIFVCRYDNSYYLINFNMNTMRVTYVSTINTEYFNTE